MQAAAGSPRGSRSADLAGVRARCRRMRGLPAARPAFAFPRSVTDSPAEQSTRMTRAERRASASLAMIFAARMLGLFLVLPVFALEAARYPGGSDPALVGL